MMFANVEINPRLFGDFMTVKTEQEIFKTKASIESNYNVFGAELEADFWIVHPWLLDIGLNTAVDAGFGTVKNTTTAGRFSISNTTSTYTLGVTLAPAVQFNLGEHHSFFLAPGFRFGVMNYKYEISTGNSNYTTNKFFFTPEFALDLGYKFWFNNFLGLNAGYQLEVPLSIQDGGDKLDYDSAIANRVYIGLCLNLGDRHISK